MKPRALYLIIGSLVVVLLGGAVLIAWGYWQIYGIGGWRDQLYASEGAVASRQALDDFRAGRLRLYTLGGESEKAKFTGTNDGPFRDLDTALLSFARGCAPLLYEAVHRVLQSQDEIHARAPRRVPAQETGGPTLNKTRQAVAALVVGHITL
jgi:hypothetical protein